MQEADVDGQIPLSRPDFRLASITECSWSKRDFETYKEFLFPDATDTPRNMTELYQAGWRFYSPNRQRQEEALVRISPEELQTFFVGLGGFFRSDSTVLDIGSGSGKADVEMAEQFSNKGTKIVALDQAYFTEKPVKDDPKMFVAGSWDTMPFPANTFTGLLCCESFPRHAWEESTPEGHQRNIQTIQEITRVAKPSALWRATLGGMPPDSFVKAITEHGWEALIYQSRVMAAKLQYKLVK